MTDPVTIVRTDAELTCPRLDGELTRRGYDLVLLPSEADEETLCRAVANATVLLTCYATVSARVIGSAPRLAGIVKYGVGIDAIDIPAAMARGIPVVNVPEYAEETVAEGAFALLLALTRKLIPVDRAMHEQGWLWPEPAWLGRDLAGSTVGLVGVGRIGRAFARMAGAGFRARVLGFDPNVCAAQMRDAGVERCEDLGAMLARCDAVSVHCTLDPRTRHLLGLAEFAAMKPGAFLVNVSRGAIVDEDAMLAALTSGRLAGAGLDVFSREPLALTGHPLSALFAMPNVILSPHLTFYTREAMERLEVETLERCDEILEGRPVRVKSLDPRLRAQDAGVSFGA